MLVIPIKCFCFWLKSLIVPRLHFSAPERRRFSIWSSYPVIILGRNRTWRFTIISLARWISIRSAMPSWSVTIGIPTFEEVSTRASKPSCGFVVPILVRRKTTRKNLTATRAFVIERQTYSRYPRCWTRFTYWSNEVIPSIHSIHWQECCDFSSLLTGPYFWTFDICPPARAVVLHRTSFHMNFMIIYIYICVDKSSWIINLSHERQTLFTAESSQQLPRTLSDRQLPTKTSYIPLVSPYRSRCISTSSSKGWYWLYGTTFTGFK